MTTESATDFCDIRNHGFARVAVVIPRCHVADPGSNAREHLGLLRTVYDQGATYAVCPELGLSAYSCGDLFFDDTLLSGVADALHSIVSETAQMNMAITVGMPLVVGDGLFNCGVTMYRGALVAVAPKSYLPNYREFYERRWFTPARACRRSEVDLLGAPVPTAQT